MVWCKNLILAPCIAKKHLFMNMPSCKYLDNVILLRLLAKHMPPPQLGTSLKGHVSEKNYPWIKIFAGDGLHYLLLANGEAEPRIFIISLVLIVEFLDQAVYPHAPLII